MKFLSRWRPRHLLAAWSGYWLTLGIVTLGPLVPAVLRATRAGAKGSITAAMGDNGLQLTVIDGGTTLWSGTASLLSLVFWIFGPPIVLWIVWLARRPSPAGDSAAKPLEALSEPAPDIPLHSRPHSTVRREPE